MKDSRVDLHAFETGPTSASECIDFQITGRPHSALGGRTPVEAHQRSGLQATA